ncbi:hypothetical protein C2E23DRAFT_138048 [Lenzites betulinus]|nr:hypothetical protein C2E23DRAFT_138048 [Lenzites betulinus]
MTQILHWTSLYVLRNSQACQCISCIIITSLIKACKERRSGLKYITQGEISSCDLSTPKRNTSDRIPFWHKICLVRDGGYMQCKPGFFAYVRARQTKQRRGRRRQGSQVVRKTLRLCTVPQEFSVMPSIGSQGTQGDNPHSSTMRASSDIRVLVLRWLPRRVGSLCCPFVTKRPLCPARRRDESESVGIKPKDGKLSELSMF